MTQKLDMDRTYMDIMSYNSSGNVIIQLPIRLEMLLPIRANKNIKGEESVEEQRIETIKRAKLLICLSAIIIGFALLPYLMYIIPNIFHSYGVLLDSIFLENAKASSALYW